MPPACFASSLNAQGLESMYSPSHEEAVPSSLNEISLSVSSYPANRLLDKARKA